MTNSGRPLPKEVIEHWPEVLNGIQLNVLPMRYLDTVMVTFKDGKSWEIKVTASTKRNGWPAFEKSLSELFKTYEERIDNVDFKLDIKLVRKDIEKQTQKFLKRKKL